MSLCYAEKDSLLHKAVLKNDLAMVKNTLESGVDINSLGEHGNTALVLASIYGYTEIAAYLIEQNADLEKLGVGEETPLLHAIDNDRRDIVELLLQHGANIHALTGTDNKNALMLAIWQKNEKTALELIKRGIDLNHRARGEENSPLLLAACFDQLQVFKTLTDKYGMDIFERDNMHGKNSLIEAAHCGAITVLEYLIARKYPLNLTDNDGANALYYADNLDVIRKLHKAGLNLNQKDHRGLNALSHAIANNKTQIIEYLQNNGAHEITIGPKGDTLLIAAVQSNNIERVKHYLKLGIDVNIRNSDGFTAFMAAIGTENTEIINLLLEYDIDVNGDYNHTGTPLEAVIDRGEEDLALRIIDKGANLETTNGYSSPLQQAIRSGLFRVVDKILDKNPKPTAIPEYYFKYALEHNDIHLIKKLYNHYQQHFTDNRWTGSALYQAANAADTNIVKFFLQQGADLHYQEYKERQDFGVLRAAYEGDRNDNFDLLVKAGADLQSFIKFLEPKQNLKTAYEHNYLGQVAIHLDYTIFNKTDMNETLESMLTYLIFTNQRKLIEYVLQNKKDFNINKANQQGITPLLAAVAMQNILLTQQFIKRGADVNTTVLPSGLTPLILAVKRKNMEMIALLLRSGADQSFEDKLGKSAIDYARELDTTL